MSLNKVLLIGYVAKDPDVRHVDNGVAVAEVRLGTTEKGYTLPNGTQVPDRTEWHNIVFWRGLAQTVERYVRKGDKIFVEGKIQKRSYRDRSGKQHDSVDILAERLELMRKPATPPGNSGETPRTLRTSAKETGTASRRSDSCHRDTATSLVIYCPHRFFSWTFLPLSFTG